MGNGEYLKIGEIPYLDCYPYFGPLKLYYSQDFYKFFTGHPTELNQAVKQGDIDLTIGSSIEYALSPNSYVLLPELCIGSTGKIKSVLLFTDILLEDLDEMTISLPTASATSSMLLKIILGKYLQYNNQFKHSWADADAHLLIGDSALRERTLGRYQYVYDLGELWRHYTGLPMVFALWLVNRSSAFRKREWLVIAHRSLKYSIEGSRADWQKLLATLKGYDWLAGNEIIKYWQGINYSLTTELSKGLIQFYKDAEELNLIDEAPEDLEFLEIPE